MTRKEMIKVANKMTLNDLMDKLVMYGAQLDDEDYEPLYKNINLSIEVIKEEITNRVMGL